jgi:hypothetical protein
MLQGISLNDLFSNCKWKGDSREVVLGIIRAVRPSFIPIYPPPEIHYKSPLLNHLNEKHVSGI